MAATPPQVPDASPPPPPGSYRASVVALVVILAACATIVLFRNAIRVRWWSHQLATASSPPERAHYLDLLLRSGEAALPAARALASRDDAALRTYAVALAATVSGPAADELLARAARDEDDTVQRNAILSLARRGEAGTAALRRLTEVPEGRIAQRAVFALGLVGTSAADDDLLALARGGASPGVRAEAIQALAAVPADVARDTLIDCLGDEAVFAGPLVFEQEAMAALGAAAPQRAGEGLVGGPASNASRAARVLHALTGQDFGDPDAAVADRGAIQAAWRDWAAAGIDREKQQSARGS